MKSEIVVAYSKDEYYWRHRAGSIETLYLKDLDESKIIDCICYVCFVSGAGIYFETEGFETSSHGIFPITKSYTYENPGPEVLEYLCEMELFGHESNAKMWYCAFKYSLENKDCIAFWKKYKHTIGGARFMSLILGHKEMPDI